jgi:hypothetical protein
MIRSLAFALAVLFSCPALAQAPDTAAPSAPDTAAAPPPRTMPGTWEFSNADREKTCAVTFRNENGKAGKRIEFEPKCVTLFPFVTDIVGWRLNDNDFLRLLDAQGESILEFNEVESGMFEAPKPGEGILFIQNPTDLGAPPKTAEQITGDWSVVRRTGKPICELGLTNTAQGEEFIVRVAPGCDPVVARFGPTTWQMDRGDIVLRSANGQSWRFEEGEEQKWQRDPPTANPLFMVRK